MERKRVRFRHHLGRKFVAEALAVDDGQHLGGGLPGLTQRSGDFAVEFLAGLERLRADPQHHLYEIPVPGELRGWNADGSRKRAIAGENPRAPALVTIDADRALADALHHLEQEAGGTAAAALHHLNADAVPVERPRRLVGGEVDVFAVDAERVHEAESVGVDVEETLN